MKTFTQWLEAYRGDRKGQIRWTYEDEAHARELEYVIDYTYSPPEPMVRYYKDGSGYPGAPADIEFWRVTCTKITQYDANTGDVVRSGPPNPAEAKTLADQFDTLIQTDDRLRERLEEEVAKDLPDPSDRY